MNRRRKKKDFRKADNVGNVMNENKMREALLQEAERLQIPECLMPEKVEERLAEESLKKESVSKESLRNASQKPRRILYGAYAVCAAAMLAVCSYALFETAGIGYLQPLGLFSPAKDREMGKQEGSRDADSSQGNSHGQMTEPGNTQEEHRQQSSDKAGSGKDAQSNEALQATVELKKADAGELYVVASDYWQVYDVIMQSAKYYYNIRIDDALTDGVVVWEAIEEESSASGSVPEDFAKSSQAVSSDINADVGEARKEFSTTNLQMEGVDESDIVKTDGSYLYIVRNNRIHIVDVRGGEPREAGSLDMASDSEILEIYVDDDKLIVVVQEISSELKTIESAVSSLFTAKQQYQTVTQRRAVLYTYSLENPAKPELLGSVGQDGYYHTSRKIGDKVYLFTDEWMNDACDGSSRYSEDWVPVVGEEQIAADCIYIPQSGGKALLISSMDVDKPDEIYDSVMIVNDSVTVYVSMDAIYLYNTRHHYKANTSYSGSKVQTEIAKFSLSDGCINAVGAANVNGSVTDTFAVNAYEGMLRILTNDHSGEGSSLYILDEKLAVLGKIEDIAPGEHVYAARYLGDMAYFVTYRNVDPLFAADLSDPAKPVILGELKITGYSEYLHMWKEGTMYGIGYETDPDTGRREGVKLAMFDVSDPVNLSVLDNVMIANADYSPAMYQYKTILSDYDKNLIGFVVTDYDKSQSNTYLLFQWKDGAFENILTVPIENDAENVRGLYVGDYFYIVTANEVIGFDRTEEFCDVGKLKME